MNTPKVTFSCTAASRSWVIPTAGAWCSYGLGSANQNLPAYVVLQSGGAVPHRTVASLCSVMVFYPAQHQGSILKADKEEAIRNIRGVDGLASPAATTGTGTRTGRPVSRGMPLMIRKSKRQSPTLKRHFRMQTAVPELCDISDETAETQQLYGLDSQDAALASYGRQCLLARRLVQRGVRFIELSCLTRGIGAGGAANPWDQHSALEKGHRAMATQVDQPIAALIQGPAAMWITR